MLLCLEKPSGQLGVGIKWPEPVNPSPFVRERCLRTSQALYATNGGLLMSVASNILDHKRWILPALNHPTQLNGGIMVKKNNNTAVHNQLKMCSFGEA